MALQEKFSDQLPLPGRSPDWQREFPRLSDGVIVLRELKASDAASLVRNMADESVRRYIAPPPTTTDGFRRFIRWSQVERRKGIHITLGVVPPDEEAAVGIFQLWRVEPDFSTAEWGLALGSRYWGRGIAEAASRLLMDFAFDTAGVSRLEARAVVDNHRGNALLTKLGAQIEGTLRQAFRQGDRIADQHIWSILADERPGKIAPVRPILI